MEVWYTVKPYKTSGRRPSTASPSPGLPYEEFAERLAARLGYELVAPLGTVGRLRALSPAGPVTVHVHTHVREDARRIAREALTERGRL